MTADSLDRLEWDTAVSEASGHLLQSWTWGEFKSEFGWGVERVHVRAGSGIAVAQILFRARGPVAVGYIPRGPAIPGDDPELASALIAKIDEACRKRHTLYTIFETDQDLPFQGNFKQHGFVLGPQHVQPGRTVKIPLGSDDAILAGMRQNTRYSVRLAGRRGVEIRLPGGRWSIDDFYAMLRETSDRNSFGIHSAAYYRRFLEQFGENAYCGFAESEGNLAAGLICARFGDEAIYMYGASSTEYRQHGAAFLLQFSAMQWAREQGALRYDLWGIPKEDPQTVSDSGDSIAGTKGDDWRGLYRFKTGFGGEIVSYPPCLERRYSQIGSYVARRMISQQRGDS
jgi:peptidoglycan pentaglycine glycine transferase (the first glycine)